MPGLLSISTPRSLKMATAAGESLSAIRTLGMDDSMLEMERGTRRDARAGKRLNGLDLGPGPVEPGRQRFQVSLVDGGATPDAQPRRRGAIAGDIQRHV